MCVKAAWGYHHLTLKHLGGRQQSDITLALSKPGRINEPLSAWVNELVSIADGAIANARHSGDIFGALGLAHEMRGHVDACCRDRQRRSTGQSADSVRFQGNLFSDVRDVIWKAQLSTIAIAERRWICGLCDFVVAIRH